MEFVNKLEPDVNKPLIIAAMQDMGNVGSIVVNFINKGLSTVPFRFVKLTDLHMSLIKEVILRCPKSIGNIDTEMAL